MELLVQLLLFVAAILISLLSGKLHIACGCFFLCCVLEIAVSKLFQRHRERQLEELTTYLMDVQDSLTLPEFQHCREGNLGILESEIYKLIALLNERTDDAIKSRTFLADMLSDISHQLKTPLAGITILADLLKDSELPAEKRIEFAKKINRQADQAAWLIRALLIQSQLDAGVLVLKPSPVSLCELLEEVCLSLWPLAENKGVVLQLQAGEAPHTSCDPRWTVEAISNIVKNCIEHTLAGGSVTLSAQQTNFAATILITDTGEGIAAQDIPQLFQRFHRVGNASADSVGIGLSLAKQIITLQNGDITVESTPGEGTRFQIRIYSG